jgi:DNA (cytosine-5)-methyltransferase 1
VNKLKVLDLFSGIGGFSLGLERTGGFETVAFCEIEPFPRKVLAKHWRETPIYEDVRTLTAEQLAADGITVDVITGGFPCQDISLAGKQAGIGEGTRSGLWSECLRLVSELRPKYAIFENVTNLLSGPSEQLGGWFSTVLTDLAAIGYDAEWENIPASALGASHRRSRVWIIAYPNSESMARCGKKEVQGFAKLQRLVHSRGVTPFDRMPSVHQSRLCRSHNGIPNQMDRVKACGNAVVPQITELIGRAIMENNNG